MAPVDEEQQLGDAQHQQRIVLHLRRVGEGEALHLVLDIRPCFGRQHLAAVERLREQAGIEVEAPHDRERRIVGMLHAGARELRLILLPDRGAAREHVRRVVEADFERRVAGGGGRAGGHGEMRPDCRLHVGREPIDGAARFALIIARTERPDHVPRRRMPQHECRVQRFVIGMEAHVEAVGDAVGQLHPRPPVRRGRDPPARADLRAERRRQLRQHRLFAAGLSAQAIDRADEEEGRAGRRLGRLGDPHIALAVLRRDEARLPRLVAQRPAQPVDRKSMLRSLVSLASRAISSTSRDRVSSLPILLVKWRSRARSCRVSRRSVPSACRTDSMLSSNTRSSKRNPTFPSGPSLPIARSLEVTDGEAAFSNTGPTISLLALPRGEQRVPAPAAQSWR